MVRMVMVIVMVIRSEDGGGYRDKLIVFAIVIIVVTVAMVSMAMVGDRDSQGDGDTENVIPNGHDGDCRDPFCAKEPER